VKKNAALPPAYQRRLDAMLPECLDGKWPKHGGHRLIGEPSVISVPLGRRYRLLLRDAPLRVDAVLTHSDYNNRLKNS